MRNFAIKVIFLMKNTYNRSVLYNNINQTKPFLILADFTSQFTKYITKRITWSSTEYETIIWEEDGAFGWKKNRASDGCSSSFFPSVRKQVRSQSINHQFFSREQCWLLNLWLQTSASYMTHERTNRNCHFKFESNVCSVCRIPVQNQSWVLRFWTWLNPDTTTAKFCL